MTKPVILTCILVLLAVTAVCPARASNKTVITLLTHENSLINELGIIRDFNLSHPDIQVNIISIGIDSTDAQFSSFLDYFLSDPSRIDVMLIDIIRPAEFALLDWAAPLDVYVSDDYISDFLTAPLQACKYRDSLYALPVYINGGLLYYC